MTSFKSNAHCHKGRLKALSSPGATASTVGAGRSHTCAVLNGGGVKCWGNNSKGQLGIGSTRTALNPTSVASDTGKWRFCQAFFQTLWRCSLRHIYKICPPIWTRRLTVLRVQAGSTLIDGGKFHTCSLKGTGGIQCWGSNSNGQLGIGSTIDTTTPKAVQIGSNKWSSFLG